MSGEGAAVSARARPLSGGLWTLFSWLRRDDRSSSDDSLSSAGSDRTAASFAFLPPPAPTHAAPAYPLPPPSPPTDSYRKRVHERNLRRQHDRDLTLHRKYGLFWGDVGYDAFSLPSARRGLEPVDRQERDRRAASEYCQRRAAHVPGKRRAPPPPATLPVALTHRHTRKRRAPQPPLKLPNIPRENQINYKTNIVLMNPKQNRDRPSLSSVENSMGCKSEKYSKKDSSKDTKSRTEKSFLKQIFENRKRNSAVETAPIKILPSISELDKQAAEIIETYKLKRLEQNNNLSEHGILSNGEMWFCTKCLRKYNSTVVNCLHCPPEKNLKNGLVQSISKTIAANASNMHTQTEKGSPSNVASSSRVSGVGVDEKQKLKEMLKEMKDSLPKRPKHENDQVVTKTNPKIALDAEKKYLTEIPTLRIGTTISNENKLLSTTEPQPSSSKQTSENPVAKTTEGPNSGILTSQDKPKSFSESVVITEQVVFVGPRPKDHTKLNNQHLENRSDDADLISNPSSRRVNVIKDVHSTKVSEDKLEANNKIAKEINTPLKISSLLNPVYVPKNNISEGQSRRTMFFSQAETKILAPQVIKPPVKIINEVQLASPKKVICIATTSERHMAKEQSNTESKLLSENEKLSKIALTRESKPKEENEVPIIKKLSPSQESSPVQPVINKTDKSKISAEIDNKAAVLTSPSTPKDKLSSNMVKFSADQHSRRRDLINQLEQSIAKGDEKAAAEAAVKLAQLRLSCSVLSFSSQIIGEFSKLAPLLQENSATSSKIGNDSKTKPVEQTSSNGHISVSSTPALPKENNKPIINKVEKAVSTSNEIKEIKPSASITKSELLKNIPSENKNKISAQTVQFNPSTSREIINVNGSNMTSVEVWVEDREATRGPIRLRIPRQAVMGDLRRQAETSLGLAARLQRWIVGRALCTDDHIPLVSLAGADLTAPFYLCVVESEATTETSALKTEKTTTSPEATLNPLQDDKAGDVYSELVQLEKRALFPNAEPFECDVCMEECAVGEGAVLRDCVHIFCRNCLSDLVRHCEEPAVSCPAMGCPGVLQEREIRALVLPEDYERWLARGLAAAESGTRNAFHCRTRDCTGWALCDPGVRRFPCPVCKCSNCIPCQAIHEGETCEQHRCKLQKAVAAGAAKTDDEGTQALLDTLITKGEALQCPECSAIITKKWGCDWVKCSACKTEICWVTRGRRWGPAGRGDTSAGCRCGVDGKRCHPSCGYCH